MAKRKRVVEVEEDGRSCPICGVVGTPYAGTAAHKLGSWECATDNYRYWPEGAATEPEPEPVEEAEPEPEDETEE